VLRIGPDVFWARWHAGRVYSMPGTIIMWVPLPLCQAATCTLRSEGSEITLTVYGLLPPWNSAARGSFLLGQPSSRETSHNLPLLICGFSNFFPPSPSLLLLLPLVEFPRRLALWNSVDGKSRIDSGPVIVPKANDLPSLLVSSTRGINQFIPSRATLR